MSKDRHVFTFNPLCNGGEQFYLVTSIDTSDGSKFVTQELSLQSYSSAASFNLEFFMTPAKLRQLANELDKFLIENEGFS